MLKLNSEEIVYPVQTAIFNASLAVIARKLKVNNSVERDWFLDLETCPRSGYVFEYCPLAVNRTGL
jgi:hypothetical protein